ncbi:lytic murein transglycosylase [Profundibacterium mesophilum]|uniref:Membrane bound lytic murein transglycosylase B n=1 Tax=Profundibacterium mesophilum KAUST100406-0324 TaxID=1037889 RepID=A0A921TBQ3_9RHOB|nr:lytic murein transglycosylase [Profundibacterium mesophilum]KAF0676050.1 Membrane bound lytic murein transglycosylase B [Profundibacterium mesophilum KAUST100406-0324]
MPDDSESVIRARIAARRREPGRRAVLLGGGSLLLAGCAAPVARGVVDAAPDPVERAVPNAGFDIYMRELGAKARAQGISADVASRAVAMAGYLPGVIEKDGNQSEFSRSLEDYIALAASEKRVEAGRAAMARNARTLAAIEAKYGVPAEIVAAIWGVESRFGARRGTIPVVSATATLAYDGRRRAFFEKQFIAALRIVQNGDIALERMTGSWAGAMGHTQFIPTSYEAFAVDFTNDGRRDIWSEDPADALASTAAYLAKSGWRTGLPWAIEVSIPAGFDMARTGRGAPRSSAQWAAAGLRPAAGGTLPDLGQASLIAPAGPNAPAFLASRNFTAITRYNNSESYVIGVGHLSDRLRGAGPLRIAFPPDANGLRLSDRQSLQERLSARGFDTGGTDGVIGPQSRAAIAAYQRSRGLPPTGNPSLGLLAGL